MEKRGIVIHPEELTEQMIEILKNTNINVIGIHPAGGEKADENLEKLLKLSRTNEFQENIRRVKELGISIEYEMHALSWLIPREIYKTHQDWFRVNKEGKRVADYNFCVSNEEAMEFLKGRASELANQLKSDTGKYYFWADDVPNAFCNCDKCRELSPSDQVLKIYHAILEGVRKVDTEAKQCYLAYKETMELPVKIKPMEGIFLEYAPMHRNTKIPLKDKMCIENQNYYKAVERLLDFFGWRDAQVLEYWLDNSMFSEWKKPPKYMEICTETICEDIKEYKRLGFEGITSFGCYLSDEYIDLYGIPPIAEYAECFLVP